MTEQVKKFQVNFKTAGGTLINVYGESVVDAIATMNEMAGAADLIRTIEGAFGTHTPAAPVPTFARPAPPAPPVPEFPSSPAWGTTPAVSAPAAVAPASAAPTQGAHVCVHGEMTYRTGNGAKGPWQAYFCPTPKGTPGQCDPHFLR